MPRYLIPLGIVALGVIIYSLIEALMTPRHQVRAMPKGVWILLIILIPLVGALLWLFLGRRRGSSASRGTSGGTAPRNPPRSPDDDAAFLHQLDVQRKQQARQAELDRREAELRAREGREGRPGNGPTGTPDSTPENSPENSPKPDGGPDQA